MDDARSVRPGFQSSGFNYELFGITIAIIGNILINVALNVQRYAHLRIKRIEDSHGSMESSTSDHDDSYHKFSYEYLRNSVWWLGILLMTVGETGNFLAYGFAPASIVSPLGVFALLSNCIVAPLFFHEKLQRRNLVGVAVAVVGILFILLSSQSTGGDDMLSPEDMLYGAVVQTSFKIYAATTCSLAGILLYANVYGRLKPDEMSFLFSNIVLVALFGAYTALSTKGLSRILSLEFGKAFGLPITYILILVVSVTAALQVAFLNRALKHFDATLVIPLHFVFFTISVVLGSAVAFREFEEKDPLHIFSFILGCFFTFIGVWLIASAQKTTRISKQKQNHRRESHNVDSLVPETRHSGNPLDDESQGSTLLLSSSRPILARALSTAAAPSEGFTKGFHSHESTALLHDHDSNGYSAISSYRNVNGVSDSSLADNSIISYINIGPFCRSVLRTKKSLSTLRSEENVQDDIADDDTADDDITDAATVQYYSHSHETNFV